MTYDVFSDIVRAEFPDVTADRMDRFREMEGLYREWNSRINVISRKDIDGFYEHHVLHSLAVGSYWRREGIRVSGLRVLDVGTGGGFPGIPLAVMYPDVDFTLCDSIGKKTLVAGEVAKALGLENVKVVNARAESLPDTYDYVVSRAVTTLENFYPWVRDKFRGSIFYLKGGDVNAEIAQLMGRFRLKKGSVRTWRIDNWLTDEYFQEKFVIQIEKSYLCGPIAENI